MYGTRQRRRKHLRADANVIHYSGNVRREQNFIGFLALPSEKIVSAARILAAWALFEQNPMGRRMPAMHRDHPVNEYRDAGRPGRLEIRGSMQHLKPSDMVSVNIRSSLVQLATPDAMRGRVSAVNMLFIGASSELGAFESGIVASMLGTVESVVLGGIGTLFVAAIGMAAFPALRKADRVHPITQASEACCEPVVDSLI
jgi:hypothetical protein